MKDPHHAFSWDPALTSLETELNIRCYLDDETSQPHLYRHDVSEQEVEEVLTKPGEDRVVPAGGRPGRHDARIAMGKTRAGTIPAGGLCP